MNVFTTDHPLASRPSHPRAGRDALFSMCGCALLIAVLLFPILLGAGWVAGVNAETPDVPETTTAEDVMSGAVCVVAYFPAFLVAPSDAMGGSFLFVGVAVDSVFWAFAGVIAYQLVAGCYRAMRVSAADSPLASAVPGLVSSVRDTRR